MCSHVDRSLLLRCRKICDFLIHGFKVVEVVLELDSYIFRTFDSGSCAPCQNLDRNLEKQEQMAVVKENVFQTTANRDESLAEDSRVCVDTQAENLLQHRYSQGFVELFYTFVPLWNIESVILKVLGYFK